MVTMARLIARADVWQASSLHSKYTRRKSVEGVIDLLTAVGSQPVPALGPGTLSHSLQHSTRSHHELTPRRPLWPRMLSIPTCSLLFCPAPHLQPPKQATGCLLSGSSHQMWPLSSTPSFVVWVMPSRPSVLTRPHSLAFLPFLECTVVLQLLVCLPNKRRIS